MSENGKSLFVFRGGDDTIQCEARLHCEILVSNRGVPASKAIGRSLGWNKGYMFGGTKVPK